MGGLDHLEDFVISCLGTLYPPGVCGAKCTSASLSCRVQEVEVACCGEHGNCPSSRSVPLTCPVECAMLYPAFVSDCAPVFPARLRAERQRLETFAHRCEATDPTLLVEYASALQARGCSLNFSAAAASPSLGAALVKTTTQIGPAPGGPGGAQNRRQLGVTELVVNASSACPWNGMQEMLQEVDNSCCSSSSCEKAAVPSTCSPLCAVLGWH